MKKTQKEMRKCNHKVIMEAGKRLCQAGISLAEAMENLKINLERFKESNQKNNKIC